MKALPHILVLRLSAMGDVAMVVPVLQAFCKTYPNVSITVVTRTKFIPLFNTIPNLSVLPFLPNGKHKGLVGLYRLAKEIKALQVTAIADLHNVLRTKIIKILLSKIPFQQLDKGRKEKKALISGKIFKPLKSTHQRYADVFTTLHVPFSLENPIFPAPKKISKNATAVVGIHATKWVAIAPFAAYEGKIYPLEDLQIVIEKLTEHYKVLLFGGGATEEKELEKITQSVKNCISVAGKLSVAEELQVISNCSVMLAMDSANGHLAAIFGIPVVTIWGVTHPYAGFKPFQQPDRYQLLSNRDKYPLIPTSVYGNSYPENYATVSSSIPPEQVINTILTILEPEAF